jgi:RNA polymerase sigma factor (sigma-70 family)
MITEQEAQDLMIKLIELRKTAQENKSSSAIDAFRQHELVCIDKFKYLITMRTSRYRNFNNYEDLVQEGHESLLRAMRNYDPKKGSWFYWAHKYIDTKIARAANAHTAIRYPIKVAREMVPHRETELPVMIEEKMCPDKLQEASEMSHLVRAAISTLTPEQQDVVALYYGFDGDKPTSINRICKKLHISRNQCLKLIQESLTALRGNIKL